MIRAVPAIAMDDTFCHLRRHPEMVCGEAMRMARQ